MRAALLLVGVVIFAGCAGKGAGPAAADGPVIPAGVAEGSFAGGATLVGLVQDGELNPIPGAIVVVVDVANVTTDEAGRFEVRNVPPGRHDVLVQALGYESVGRSVLVAEGASVEVVLILGKLRVDEAYHETQIHAGHVCFQVQTGQGTIVNFGNIACGGSGSIFVNFTAGKMVETILAEMVWVKNSGLTANEFRLLIFQGGSRSGVFTCEFCYGEAVGPSPLILRVDGPFEGIPQDGEEEMYELDNTIYVPRDPNNPVGTQIVLDQRVTIYDSMFYGAKAPQDFSALPDA